MKYPIGDSTIVYVRQSDMTGYWTKKVNCKVRAAYFHLNDRYENSKGYQKMTYKEFKEKYPIESYYIWERYKKAEYS